MVSAVSAAPSAYQRPSPCSIAQRVVDAVKRIWEHLLGLLGSKSWSIPGLILRFPGLVVAHLLGKEGSFFDELFHSRGYHRFEHSDLTPEGARDYLIYAAAAAGTQRNKWRWMEAFGFEQVHKLYDEETGLKVVLYESPNQLLVSFGAFGSHITEYEDPADAKRKESELKSSLLGSLFGSRPAIYDKALDFVQGLGKRKLILTGQCLGGSLAQYVGLHEGITTVALNTFPIGPGLQRKLGPERLSRADELVTHVIAKGDPLSNLPRICGVADAVFNTLGLRTAGNFGRKMHVPSVYKTALDTHYYIIGSLIAKWKPQYLDLCQRISDASQELAAVMHRELA